MNMNNELTVWNYGDNDVRILMIEDEPWLVLADVCRVLEIARGARTAERLEEDEVRQTYITDSLGRQQLMTIISESGFYSVVLRSDKPQAKPFRKWVTSVVLPSIRKNGFYAGDMHFSRELQVLIQHERMMAQHQKQLDEALVQHFGGDPMCVNESRVMRLPNYYHCKKEPVLVECISFHPERRYTQEQLMQALPELKNASAPEQTAQPIKMGTQKSVSHQRAERLIQRD
ncbi:MAG: BRO family protein [Oscillospiraceae bacterium]